MIEFKLIPKYRFWKQINPVSIDYNEDYKARQQTTPEMSWLRLGAFISQIRINVNELKTWKCCDVGSGNGNFIKEAKKVFGYAVEYDLSGQTITQQELYNTKWNVIFLTDVLQHFQNIEDLFKIDFEYLFLSYPECPRVSDYKELQGWRHYKPNEHIYMMNRMGMIRFMMDHGYRIIYEGNIEDVIRKSPYEINITTMIFHKIF